MTKIVNIYSQIATKHPALFGAGFFAAGISYDFLTLARIDSGWQLLSQGLFLLLLWAILWIDLRNENTNFEANLPFFAKFISPHKVNIVHFTLGSLLSMFTILYSRSTSDLRSLIYLFLLGSLLVANELPQFRKKRHNVWLIAASLCTASFFTYLVPILSHSISDTVFFTSLLLALVSTFCITALSHSPSTSESQYPTIWHQRFRSLFPWRHILFIFIPFIFLTVLYVLKMIPPVPLSVIHTGIYHKIERRNTDYYLYQPAQISWLSFATIQEVVVRPNDKIYCFVQTFAPVGFSHRISMQWARFSSANNNWEVTDNIPIQVIGGRTTGFRGYTYKNNYRSGAWRVQVVTNDQRILSQQFFTIITDTTDTPRRWLVKAVN